MYENSEFWSFIDSLAENSEIIIDRPKGTAHPKYPNFIYPVDYGYLKDTCTTDGGGIDIWIGSEAERRIDGIICTVDLKKRDSEIKILMGCTEEEKLLIYETHNKYSMRGLFIRRQV